MWSGMKIQMISWLYPTPRFGNAAAIIQFCGISVSEGFQSAAQSWDGNFVRQSLCLMGSKASSSSTPEPQGVPAMMQRLVVESYGRHHRTGFFCSCVCHWRACYLVEGII